MTGGGRSSTSQDAILTALQERRKWFSTIPSGADEILVRDTIHLYDPATFLPNRSLERRRLFQNILKRYYHQILFGCTNPDCTTPTCLSYRQRVSKGPFRNYTVLSARSLATFLASQDHPNKGLCPHKSSKQEGVAGDPPTQVSKTTVKTTKRKISSKAAKYSRPGISSQPTLNHGKQDIPSQQNSSKDGGDENEARKENGVPLEIIRDVAGYMPPDQSKQSKSKENPLTHMNRTEKRKDPASFTQMLFDTAPMKLLQNFKIPIELMQWLSGSETNEQQTSYVDSRDVVLLQNRLPGTSAKKANHKGSLDVYCNNELTPEPTETATTFTKRDALTKEAKEGLKSIGDFVAAGENLDQHTHGPVPNDHASKKLVIAKNTGDNQFCNVIVRPETRALPPQSLSYFTHNNIALLVNLMTERYHQTYQKHKFLSSLGRFEPQICLFNFVRATPEPEELSISYCAQSIFYVLSNTQPLLRSFLRQQAGDAMPRAIRSQDFSVIVDALRLLGRIEDNHYSILSCLSVSTGKLYAARVGRGLRTCKTRAKSPRSANIDLESDLPADRMKGNMAHSARLEWQDPLTDAEASHVAKIIFAALVAFTPEADSETWIAVQKLRANGKIAPTLMHKDTENQKSIAKVLEIMDCLEDEIALSLIKKLVSVFASREPAVAVVPAVHDDSEGRKRCHEDRNSMFGADIMGLVIYNVLGILPDDLLTSQTITTTSGQYLTVILEWLRSVLLKEWDGKATFLRYSVVDRVLQLMSRIDRWLHPSCENSEMVTPFISDRLDLMEIPVQWVNLETQRNSLHLLDYPLLFPPSTVVSYFRVINHTVMYKAFEESMVARRVAAEMVFAEDHIHRSQNRLNIATTPFLVLEISRKNILTDALDQLWRRQKRELMRPLRVRLGWEEGEEGIDHGGVQQEFFRVAVAEALDPKYGVFTTDSQSRMSWFQPGSLEPLYKFELLGLLVSLAIYNGLTLPFTFPLALYMKLLRIPVNDLAHIDDGWPELAKGLRELRDWTNGDVEDVFLRSYEFSTDFFGLILSTDMGFREKHRDVEMKQRESMSIEAELDHGFSSNRKATPLASQQETSTPYESNGTNTKDQADLTKNDGEPVGSPRALTSSDGIKDTDAGADQSRSPAMGSNPFAWSEAPSSLDIKQLTEQHHAQNADAKISSGSQPTVELYRRLSRSTSSSSSFSTPMVTNANRHQYIHDYIQHLTTHSIGLQYNSFSKGFYTCLNRKSLTLFTPGELKVLVEGLPNIDTHRLQSVARYEGGYHSSHHTIKDFWTVVHNWSADPKEGQQRARQLLEFVTASDRLPVGGVERVVFVVQKNGIGDARLPTSLTCFGRLLLPEFSSVEVLKNALGKAVENSKGFGQP